MTPSATPTNANCDAAHDRSIVIVGGRIAWAALATGSEAAGRPVLVAESIEIASRSGDAAPHDLPVGRRVSGVGGPLNLHHSIACQALLESAAEGRDHRTSRRA